MEVQPMQCTAGSNGQQVLAGKQRAGRFREFQELDCRRVGPVDAMNVEPDQLRIECDTCRGQLLLVALVAVSGRGDRQEIPEVADPPMTVCDQARGTVPGSGVVDRSVS